jgi:SAM-dependent methyltransferase
VADVTSLPFKTNYFDLVICSEVMEHVVDHQAAAGELVRVLKPGYNLVVSVPRYWPERICWALSDDYRNSNQGHVRIYKSGKLIHFLESFGLNKWAIHYAHSLHTPYWWLKCLIGPTRNDASVVNLYHRFLTWDIMEQPRITRLLDRLLNPIVGKSIIIYLKKKCPE